jgi:hypothetical protein
MNLEEIKREWREAMDRSIPPNDLNDLVAVVERRCTETERQVRGRDTREVLAALVVVGAFAAMWPLYRSSPVAVFGVALIVFGSALIVYMLMRSRTQDPAPFHNSVLEFSRTRLAWLDRQIRLLRNVVWWYVAPLAAGCLLFGWGLAGGRSVAFALHAVVVIAVATGIVLLNQWVVRRHLQPLRDNLARLIQSLEAKEET